MRYNPKFILIDHQKSDQLGIKAMQQFFVDQKGFEMDAVRTLVVRYPYVLSKTQAEYKQFFDTMNAQGLSDEEAMRALIECPKLISRKDLVKQIKEI